ncbi:MAG: hypothetical protein GY719_25725 [bacterium]|nr:hypothetical protein [bacterium]
MRRLLRNAEYATKVIALANAEPAAEGRPPAIVMPEEITGKIRQPETCRSCRKVGDYLWGSCPWCGARYSSRAPLPTSARLETAGLPGDIVDDQLAKDLVRGQVRQAEREFRRGDRHWSEA